MIKKSGSHYVEGDGRRATYHLHLDGDGNLYALLPQTSRSPDKFSHAEQLADAMMQDTFQDAMRPY